MDEAFRYPPLSQPSAGATPAAVQLRLPSTTRSRHGTSLRGFRDDAGRMVAPGARRATGRQHCQYCGGTSHPSQFCYDPHEGCTMGTCEVSTSHRSYLPRTRCKDSSLYDPTVRRHEFIARQMVRFQSEREAANEERSRRTVHRSGRRLDSPGPSTPVSPGGSTFTTRDRPQIRLPLGLRSADGQAITRAHVQLLQAMRRYNEQEAIRAFPSTNIRLLQLEDQAQRERAPHPYDVGDSDNQPDDAADVEASDWKD